MIELNVSQGSSEWFMARMNKITSSRMKDVLKPDNLGLVDEMIAEKVTNVPDIPDFISDDMQRGSDLEPVARDEYIKKTGIEIEEVGFCISDKYDWLGLSPDGFTPDRKGGIEIKCPKTKTHVKYVRQGQIPNEYRPQTLEYFLVNEKLEWLDFISFDPRFKVKPLFIHRITREEITDQLEDTMNALIKFNEKLIKYYKQVTF